MYDKADTQTQTLITGLQAAIKQKAAPITINHVGTMFTVFFTNQSVARLADVNACDLDMFKTYFHFMKDHGILLPPSQYEANFVSSEHSDELIEKTISTFTLFLEKHY